MLSGDAVHVGQAISSGYPGVGDETDTFESSLGGGVLTLFGPSQTHESDPELAVRAAIEASGVAFLSLGVSPES